MTGGADFSVRSKEPFDAIDGQFFRMLFLCALFLQAAGADVRKRMIQRAAVLMQRIQIFQIFPLRDAGMAVLRLQPFPLVKTFGSLAAVA